jgi:hypothetical protein
VTVDRSTEIPDAREIRALWTGLLLPPLAFLINLELAYALVPPACTAETRILVHVVHLASFLLALYGWLVARRCWQRAGRTWPGQEGESMGRNRFMAGLGILTGALFLLVIVAQWIPSLLLDPCQ